MLATTLCDRHATLHESADALLVLADASPEWFLWTTDHYRACGLVGPHATGHDVAVRRLLLWIDSTRWAAERSGDPSRAAALSARLTELETEAGLAVSPPSH